MTQAIDAATPLWFYDFVSPFSYLLLEQQDKWPSMPFTLVPVSVQALYRHWGQRAASEVPPKRVFTYRHALFRAEQLGIPFRMPPAHPFDSTKPLLLAAAIEADLATVCSMFRFIWREGRDPSTADGFADLCSAVGIPHGERLIEHEDSKARLQRNLDDAVALDVFGVPTFRLNRQIFWGEDALPMLLYCARSPGWLESPEVRRVSELPLGHAG
ncbi:DsbA family protein [Trinickia caryophylli]|uniref:2-hydroxychromene-2-carboxylate isomerase n=1 Tax=Trinickia caryophylli TaxID=28094 RepID=A0A1X7CFV9_TRICW|nr:DsbA family protein [Trinickia caryophylli]PMS11612.1 2-hydroxychromene-2-carboxylate isomerase [Trinickia caryophylli]TRX19829.1 2-hydroxychromene-2-carboxylate isomerase [Trinickia caryophylli]WQE12841.1 DsbA family protein [Trinickia caryophylli]SME95627.1 2-hydroxychromene-2-carboxylate isomerase [Trinickia caryophylli]GLU30562.1 isomerase [Trinickia caryophylli]